MVVNAAAQTVLVPVNYVLEVDADGPTRAPCEIGVGGMIVIAPKPRSDVYPPHRQASQIFVSLSPGAVFLVPATFTRPSTPLLCDGSTKTLTLVRLPKTPSLAISPLAAMM